MWNFYLSLSLFSVSFFHFLLFFISSQLLQTSCIYLLAYTKIKSLISSPIDKRNWIFCFNYLCACIIVASSFFAKDWVVNAQKCPIIWRKNGKIENIKMIVLLNGAQRKIKNPKKYKSISNFHHGSFWLIRIFGTFWNDTWAHHCETLGRTYVEIELDENERFDFVSYTFSHLNF